MNETNFEHAIYAVLLQIAVGVLTGNWWIGAAAGVFFFLGREHAQFERKLAVAGGTVGTLNPLAGFQLWKWSLDSQLDLAFPVGERFGRAVDFLGYRIWTTHRRIRKSSISRITRTLKRLRRQYAAGKIDLSKIRESVMSWIAHASHAETYGLRRKLLASIPFTRGEGWPQ